MKFRGVLTDHSAMLDFMHIAVSLSKFAKECIMRITVRNVYFIISSEDNGPKMPLVWCELPVNFYFQEYNVKGINEESNEIYLELSTALLARSLSAIKQNIKQLKIKLTDKEQPCLTLEMNMLPGEIQSRQCIHDIPVDVIAKKHWSNYAEPTFSEFHVSIQMPHLKLVKNIADRLKTMSPTLIVSANKFGRLSLKIKTSVVTLSAHFPDLNVESFAVGLLPSLHPNFDNEDNEDNQTVSATIDVKKFLMFLAGMQLNNCRTLCSIVHGKMVKLYMEQPGAMKLQIFLTEQSS